jgi:Fur family peroxide stress response transcriptional regulator
MGHAGTPAERLTGFELEFRRRGLPLTTQRRVILEELLGRRDHPTADQIFEVVRERLPSLSRTTVYRVLEALVEVGAARRVLHPDAVARFDPVTDRHHHLVCERCGALVDIGDEAVARIGLPDTGGMGFQITNYSINFTGTCATCQ